MIYLSQEIDGRLKEMKKELKLSKADIIQNIINEYFTTNEKTNNDSLSVL